MRVAIGVRSFEQLCRRLSPVPVVAHLLQIAVDTARRNDCRLAAEFTRFASRFDHSAAASDATTFLDHVLDPAAEYVAQLLPIRMRPEQFDEALDETKPCTPEDVVARHTVTRHEVATFDPVDGRHVAQAFFLQPVEHAVRTLLDVSLRPALRPGVRV